MLGIRTIWLAESKNIITAEAGNTLGRMGLGSCLTVKFILTGLLQQKEKYISRAQVVLKKKENWLGFRENGTEIRLI